MTGFTPGLSILLDFSQWMTMVIFRFLFTETIQNYFRDNFSDKKKGAIRVGVTGTLLDASIMNGFETITRLGGYILLFSILSAFIRHWYIPHSVTEYC